MEATSNCPIGLDNLIKEVSKMMIENIGRLTMSVDVSTPAYYEGAKPSVQVFIHDESKMARKKCNGFTFYGETDRRKDNEKTWRKMLKYYQLVLSRL